jgi:type VI protein secretion system component Hcp
MISDEQEITNASELSGEELNDVNGGTKPVDNSSPKLHLTCAPGEHISTEAATSLTELSSSALDEVVGGKTSLQDMHFVKVVDKSSPTLF